MSSLAASMIVGFILRLKCLKRGEILPRRDFMGYGLSNVYQYLDLSTIFRYDIFFKAT